MKPLIRVLFAAFLGLLMVAAQTIPVKAEETAYTPAEEYVLAEVLKTGAADLSLAFEDESQRTIRGEFIVELFKNPALQETPFIKLYNATIQGDIKADGLFIPFAFECTNCKFTGRIELSSARIRSFRMYDSSVAGSVRLGRAVIEEDLALYNSTYEGAVILFGAEINGNFYAANSTFNGTQADKDTAFPFELWKTRVAQTTEFRNATIKGDAMFEEADFGGNLVLNNAVFEKTANFKDFHVGNFADAKFVVFRDTVTFESGVVDRDANFSNAVFNGSVNFDYFLAERFIDFDEAAFSKDISFRYSEAGWPDFSGATFQNRVDFTGIQVHNNLNFTDAAYTFNEQPFSISLAQVDGSVNFSRFSAPAGLSLINNKFGDLEISGADANFTLIDITSSQVEGSLTIENVNVDEFYAVEFSAEDSTAFEQLTVNKTLDMSNAAIGFFSMEKFSWPLDSESFNLRGMEYADIGLGDRELNDATWGVLLDMLEQSAYSPQAYRTLSQFLMDKGHPEWAAEVEITRKNRERDEILTPRSAPWFWSWFLFLFSGYGQRPVLAFVWSALVVAIGSIVFRKEEGLAVVDEDVVIPVYSPFLYSLDLFLPYIELGIADKWDPKPERKAAWVYKHVHRLLGWILMPIALLTFGGIIG